MAAENLNVREQVHKDPKSKASFPTVAACFPLIIAISYNVYILLLNARCYGLNNYVTDKP